jgi:D-glycero-alpha-D-manno-heptose-7-phosphate kinase
MVQNLHFVKDLGLRSRDALEAGDLDGFGKLMDEHWQHKKRRSGGMSNPKIDEWYELAMKSGATGGKLIGAGGGGFLLVYTPRPEQTREAMAAVDAPELTFDFEYGGAFASEHV